MATERLTYSQMKKKVAALAKKRIATQVVVFIEDGKIYYRVTGRRGHGESG